MVHRRLGDQASARALLVSGGNCVRISTYVFLSAYLRFKYVKQVTRSSPSKPVRDPKPIYLFVAEPAPHLCYSSNKNSTWQSIQDTNATMKKSIASLKLERNIPREQYPQKAADIAALNMLSY